MPVFDDVPRKEVTDLLNKCWMTHDGMWFFHCLEEFGIETTNRLNKSSIKSLAAMEVQRLRRLLGFDTDIDNFPDFKRFFRGAAHYMIPDFMNGSFDFPRKNHMSWVFKENRCFAYKGIKRLGVIEDYECGVLYRIKCWIEALGMTCDTTPEIGPCHMHYTGACAGDIHLHL